MKVIVFGATGTIGRLAVKAMLKAGHQVTGFARRPARIGFSDPNLTLVAGDAAHRADVGGAIRGHDAVVVAIGSGKSRKSTVRSLATLNVIQAMQQHKIDRLIVQSTLGANDSRGNLNVFWKYLMFGFLLRPVFKDHELQEKLVGASGLDWTIVRPSAFTRESESGAFRENVSPAARGLKLKISPVDVAGFLSRQITDTRYLRAAVGLSR